MMVTVLWIGVIAVCCGLCAYGINVAVRRAKETHPPARPE